MSPLGGPHRVALSVPGNRGDRFDRACRSGADIVILDLEDSVAPQAKAGAREEVRAFLAARNGHPGPQLLVRVNRLDTDWGREDLVLLAPEHPDGFLVPKVESPAELVAVDRLVCGIVASGLAIWALIESARGLAAVVDIAAVPSGLVGLVLGYADLSASLGRSLDDPAHWLSVQDAVLIAARSNDLIALDGPILSTADDDELREQLECSNALGFDGRWVIHPRQVATAREVFTPSAPAIQQARSVLERLAGAGGAAAGVAVLDGRMLDEAVAVAARRLLLRAGETDHG